MTTYEPGTVAVATVRGVPNVRVMLADNECADRWVSVGRQGRGFLWHSDENVTDVHPLVVLDLDGIAPEAIVKALRDRDAGTNGTGWARVADQIESQTKPPRIPEPTAPGSLVIASQVGEIEGSDRTWVRFRHGSSDAWIDSLEHVRSWDDLDNPRLPGGAP